MLHKYIAHNSLLPFYRAWQLDPEGYHYNLSFSYQLENSRHITCLTEALQKLIQLKGYLRQTFNVEKEQLIATIHDHLAPQINFFTISTEELAATEQRLAQEKHDINNRSSIKLNIIRFKNSPGCSVLFNIHHIILDGYGLDFFIMDLNRLLAGEKVEKESAIDYISKIKNEMPLQQWTEQPALVEYVNKINLIASDMESFSTSESDTILSYRDFLPNLILRNLASLSLQQNISLFNLLLLAFSIFMSKLFNQRTILLNYPANIRTNKSISGCFVNTVTFSTTLEEKDSYLSLIQAWPDRMNALKQVAKSTASQQLNVNTIPSFAYSYFVTPHELVIENKSYFSESHAQIARSNLAIKYREQNGKLFFKCELLSHIFPQHFAKSLLPRFFHYLDKIISAPSSPLFAIDLTFPEERKKILFDFNDTDSPYPEDKTLIDLFDAIVSQYPNKIAVKAFNGNLTYSELNQKAEHLASFLIQEGIRPDDTVAILIDNRVEMIIAIMAVLKAGGAYLPLTDNSPIDNIIYYIKDSNTKCVLTIPALAEKINLPIPIINITEVPPSFNQNYIKPPLKISNLAYIIYTSGTTGKPKGILVEHRTVVIYVNYLIKSNQLDSDSVGSKYADFSFDASVIEIYPILLSGGTLCILKDKDRLDHIEVNNFINENKITYSFLPTQFAELFFQLKNSQLSTLIVGGDKLNSFIQNSYRTINAYGPTEATVQSTSFLVDKLYENIPIGKPIDNVKCYVVDRQLSLIPPGMIGELLIGGKCLARGYLNNRELTDKKFIFNPFQTEEEKIANKNLRLYKTGDLARWLPDGNLEYIGRYDSQVKIRGYRIELAEIESKLITHSEIKQAVVLAKEYSTHSADSIDKYLVAYYVADNKLNDSDIHNYLSKQLPEYMIPAAFIHLPQLPLTTHGKIDRKAFPELEFSSITDYSPPTNTQERLVCAAFSKVLGIEKIGINDDFFKLGGNSIKAITLAVNLQNNFNINIIDIFNLKTPKKIAEHFTIEKNSLKQHLQRIKIEYKFKNSDYYLDERLQQKMDKYFDSIMQLPHYYPLKALYNILLTGATGFLGCNLLHQLLMSSNYTIFVLIRASSLAEAMDKLDKKFQFYFEKKLTRFYNQRLFVLVGDIEQENLGLSPEDYQLLAAKIGSIIHSAALTKHYGEYDRFYATNVKGTINLLEFCQLTESKDFHYISTISVLDQGYVPNYSQYFFTEDDMANEVEGRVNPYVKSKYEGEKVVIHYRKRGIISNIYRVGNLAFMINNYRFQENSEDNAFLHRLRFLLNLGVIAKEINLEQISPVDLTAQAIVHLFDKKIDNQTYHVFNPRLWNIAESFSQNGLSDFKIVPLDEFLDTITLLLDDPQHQKSIERYLLHQGWLDKLSPHLTAIYVLQHRTSVILNKLGFQWSPIECRMLKKYCEQGLKNVSTVSLF